MILLPIYSFFYSAINLHVKPNSEKKPPENKTRKLKTSWIFRRAGGRQVDSVSYRFERHGIFVHNGVGRGYIMSGGIVVRGRKASLQARNQKAENIILAGPIRRQPGDWFNPVIDKNVPELADKVAQMNADAAVNALRLRIV